MSMAGCGVKWERESKYERVERESSMHDSTDLFGQVTTVGKRNLRSLLSLLFGFLLYRKREPK